ncbi:hypothetical protein LT493_29885 [Streptomyces tricolor]|nr:hypothetical protein [Streptomyces tricolor]
MTFIGGKMLSPFALPPSSAVLHHRHGDHQLDDRMRHRPLRLRAKKPVMALF